jgi:hypothetical protein
LNPHKKQKNEEATEPINEIVEVVPPPTQPAPPPTDLRPKRAGALVRACGPVDKLFAECLATPNPSFFYDLVNVARPQCERAAKAMARRCGEIKEWVTGSKSCNNGDLSWLEQYARIEAMFTDPTFKPNKTALCDQGYASKRHMADAIRMLYLSYPQRNIRQLLNYNDLYRTYGEFESAQAMSKQPVNPTEQANTPTIAEIDETYEKADLQGKALIAVSKKFQGRSQNYVITVIRKKIDGTYVHITDSGGRCEDGNGAQLPLEADGFPGGENFYVLNDDPNKPDEYIQCCYKTNVKYGKKVGFVPIDCSKDVREWVFSDEWSPHGGALFQTTEGKAVNADNASALCKRIFFAAIGKNATPGLLRRACANTKEIREAVAVLINASEVRNHSLLMEAVSGHYCFKGPQSN